MSLLREMQDFDNYFIVNKKASEAKEDSKDDKPLYDMIEEKLLFKRR